MVSGRNGKGAKVSCDDCFFKRNGLCASNSTSAATFRRIIPRGCARPSQLRFVFRQERRRQAHGRSRRRRRGRAAPDATGTLGGAA